MSASERRLQTHRRVEATPRSRERVREDSRGYVRLCRGTFRSAARAGERESCRRSQDAALEQIAPNLKPGAPNLKPGAALLFAHGFNIRFGYIDAGTG